jgi:Fe-S cluster biosynthesis and repair protein YggX
MATLNCTCCGQSKEGLEKPPFDDDLGREVHENTCQDCWKRWLEQQVMLINEYQLLPVNPEHGEVLERNLKTFLRLPSAESGGLDQVGTPPPGA